MTLNKYHRYAGVQSHRSSTAAAREEGGGFWLVELNVSGRNGGRVVGEMDCVWVFGCELFGLICNWAF